MGARTPSRLLPFTNCAYVAEQDLRRLCTWWCAAWGDRAHVEVVVTGRACIFEIKAHPDMAAGQIGLNRLQRNFVRASRLSGVSVSQVDYASALELSKCRVMVAPFKPTD